MIEILITISDPISSIKNVQTFFGRKWNLVLDLSLEYRIIAQNIAFLKIKTPNRNETDILTINLKNIIFDFKILLLFTFKIKWLLCTVIKSSYSVRESNFCNVCTRFDFHLNLWWPWSTYCAITCSLEVVIYYSINIFGKFHRSPF